MLSWQGDARLALAEVLQLAGRQTEAMPALEHAIDLYIRKGNVVSAGKARSLLQELTVICPSCGQKNREGGALLRFVCCPSRQPAPERRKLATILFGDVVGSTRLGEHDPEVVRTTMARYFERMRTIAERHGGTVEKYIGDAVMVVFGVPRVHDDDAERACGPASRCATSSLSSIVS